MKELKQLKNEKGITLIVLIITVIVMLILAGIVINDAIGEGGLIGRAEDATNRHIAAENHELNVLNRIDSKYDQIANRIDGGNGGNTGGNQPGTTTEPNPTNHPNPTTNPTPSPTTPTGKPGKPDENGNYTENSTINGGNPSAFNPEVPKGFKPVDVDDAVWGDGSTPPSEDAVKKGLVIEDGEGNQFVWIAVDGVNVKLDRYTFAEDGTETPQGEAAINTYIQELASSDKGNAVAKDISAFKTSVAEHGGYYIARYEASYGTDGKPNSKVSTSFTAAGASYGSHKEGQLWNNITQPNAANVCRNMYDSSYGATSDLVNSYAWDTAIVFIQKYSSDTDYSRQNSLNTTLNNTGTNNDEKCHIQDMASNCLEWTTETNSFGSRPCVVRGGYFYQSLTYTSERGDNGGANTTASYVAFRPLLYL